MNIALVDRYRVRSINDNNELISYIMLLTCVTWQTPQNLNTIAILDIKHFVYNYFIYLLFTTVV